MKAFQQAWLDGRIVDLSDAAVSAASNSLNLGLAVFDGIMAYWNEDHWYLHEAEAHFQRFTAGTAAVGLAAEWQVHDLVRGARQLLERVGERTHYVRPIAYWQGPEPFFDENLDSLRICIYLVPVDRDDDRLISCQLSPVQRVPYVAIPAAWKISGAYVNSFMADSRAKTAGYDDGVMLDGAGRIAEASTSNVFFVRDDKLVTPALTEDIFPGITRRLIIEQAVELGIEVQERSVLPAELDAFSAALTCGTLSEIRGIERIDGHRFGTASDPVFHAVLDRFRKITHQ